MRTHLPRRGVAALALLTVAAACGRDEKGGAASDAGTPEPGGTAVIVEAADMNIPVAILANTVLDGDLAADVMNMGLLRGVWANGALENETAEKSPVALARSYEYVGADSAGVRFHMRSDVKWSDGRPVTAQDVAFTYGIVRDPALASGLQEYAARLDSVVAENDSTVRFHFRNRYAEMLSHASIPPLPKHVYQGTAAAQLRSHPTILDPTGGKLVTSGPWVIGSWQKGQQITLVPNPHFRPKPHLAQIVIRIIPDPSSRLVELQTGRVDMVKNVSSDKLPLLRQQAGIRLEREQKRAYDYVAYSAKGFPAFADRDVRRALSIAIDPKRVIQGVQLEDVAVPAGGPYPPISRLYDARLMPPVQPDAREARRILESKGWKDGNGDGILEKDGKPFRVTLITQSGSQRRGDASQIVQQAWKEIGVDAQLQQVEFNVFTKKLLQQDYQAALGGWNAGLTPDFVALLYGTGRPYNITGYSNPKVDALIEEAGKQPTAETAGKVWQQAAALIVQDQPYTWLYYMDVVDPVRDRLKNVRVNTYGPYINTWEWWIPKSQQGRAQTPRDTTGK